ncbi:MAG: SoxR reducing system RseC family protein [bacterium]
MKELGVVVRIEKDKGVIQLQSKGGCKSCGMNAYCHSTGTGTRELKLFLEGNKIVTGDVVEIETPARSLLTAAFLVFIFPLILSITAYFIVYSMTDRTELGLAGFFVCFILSEILVAWLDRSFGRGRFFEPRIVRMMDSGQEKKDAD